MEIILLEDLRQLGRRGDVVSVKPGYARNYLLPQGLGLEATVGNRAHFEQQRKKIEAARASEVAAAAEVAALITGTQLSVAKKAGETETLYGSVTAAEIAELLDARGISVDKRRINVGDGIKTLGDHTVTVDLHAEITAELTVTVVAEE